MTKTQIISINNYDYAVSSVSAATQLASLLSRLQPVKHDTSADDYKQWHYRPITEEEYCADVANVEIKLNQKFKPAPKPKPGPKTLALPKPKRGTILCICEKSHVAPRESCPHCGRAFSESHNRTHTDGKTSNLRLL